MFDKILIANRGEIATRVMRTAQRMQIATVAVYSDADADAKHVALADQAIHIGAAPAADSYLHQQRILQAAAASGAQAIHPGYGFLAENAEFAERCAAAGVVFIGPGADAIRSMGEKSTAKRIMANAGIPVVPGYHDAAQDDDSLQSEAERIGYPLLIKPTAGGGGKGMRAVYDANALRPALAAARREAAAAFDDERLLLERLLIGPRHIEVQVFADCHGHAVHLFDRDCSIQRRHQKVIEEAPAPGLTAAEHAAMADTAVAAAQAIDYVGAGTIEFIVDASGYYFMEMNTRLQVEHPVTEMITGQDLVEWQIRVAAGEPLPCDQDALTITGHAIEARVYAEDTVRDFLPGAGVVSTVRFPGPAQSGLRIDSAVREGDTIGVYYDPMIAKLIAAGHDRNAAIRQMTEALMVTHIGGVKTNLELLQRVLAHDAFGSADLNTDFIEQHRVQLITNADEDPPSRVLGLTALTELLYRKQQAERSRRRAVDANSPWHGYNGWRLNAPSVHTIALAYGARDYQIHVTERTDGYDVEVPGFDPLTIAGRLGTNGELLAQIGTERVVLSVFRDAPQITVSSTAQRWHFLTRIEKNYDTEHVLPGQLSAPMPGRVARVCVEQGQAVAEGEPLIVMEAMKMEHTISAPYAGEIMSLRFSVGDLVDEGVELLVLDAANTEFES